MPQYKNETTGKWYCSFYYSDWQGKRKKKKKKALIPSVKPKTGKMNSYIKPLLIAL